MANIEFRALQRNARISPTKVRPSATLIRGKRVEDALNLLRFQPASTPASPSAASAARRGAAPPPGPRSAAT